MDIGRCNADIKSISGVTDVPVFKSLIAIVQSVFSARDFGFQRKGADATEGKRPAPPPTYPTQLDAAPPRALGTTRTKDLPNPQQLKGMRLCSMSNTQTGGALPRFWAPDISADFAKKLCEATKNVGGPMYNLLVVEREKELCVRTWIELGTERASWKQELHTRATLKPILSWGPAAGGVPGAGVELEVARRKAG